MAAVAFLIWQTVMTAAGRYDPKPSQLERRIEDETQIVVCGTVDRWEETSEYRVVHLKNCRVLPKKVFLNLTAESEDGRKPDFPVKQFFQKQALYASKLLVYLKQDPESVGNFQSKNNSADPAEDGQNNQSNTNAEQKNETTVSGKTVKAGNYILIYGELAHFETASNPGNFDQRSYYIRKGFSASVWAESVQILEASVSRIKERILQLRQNWKVLLIRHLGTVYGNSMSAILLGDKSGLDESTKEMYQKSGIGHILAISGLHMSFIGMGIYQILRQTGCPIWMCGLLGTVFLGGYTILVGSGVSSIRAFLMFAIRTGADFCGRRYDMPTSLAVSASVIVLENPRYLTDAGYLLSFGAILGIALLHPVLTELAETKYQSQSDGRIRKKQEKAGSVRERICQKLGQGLYSSISVSIMLFPVTLYFYYEFPLYSPIINILVIPLMSLVLGAGIAGSVLCTVWTWGGGTILQICAAVLSVYDALCEISLWLPFSRLSIGQPDLKWVIGYYAVLLLALGYLRYMRGKQLLRRVYAGGAAVLFSLAVWTAGERYRGAFQVTMLDVGQGDGIFLRSPDGMTCLIDGGSSDVGEVGKYRLLPYLESQGVSELDYLFLSHGDTDHISGAEELLDSQELGICVKTLVLPPKRVLDEKLSELLHKAVETGTRVKFLEAEDEIRDGEMTIICAGPGTLYQGESGNAASMLLYAECRGMRMLFTGDVEGEGEKLLTKWLASKNIREYELLKVAHHGSGNSTLQPFLDQARPSIALISSGIGNRYGHPSAETVKRLEQTGCRIYGTQENGAVTILIRQKGERKAVIETYRAKGFAK